MCRSTKDNPPDKRSNSSIPSSTDDSRDSVNNGGNNDMTSIVKDVIALTAAYTLCSVMMSYILRTWIQPKGNARPVSKGGAINRLKSILSADKNKKASSSNDDRPTLSQLKLTQYEVTISSDVIDPSEISTRFADVGGIDQIKAELWDLVVLPLLRPELFNSASGLVSPPRGVLLYGAPGTGKTMLAKAVAAEGHAAFINVRLSSIMDMYFGESNKLVSATFSLAGKLAPSVIFIDELDTFLNQRGDGRDVSAMSIMKSEFLTLWDGLLTPSDAGNNKAVIVLGATNRPFDVDMAILRRLPRSFEIGLPPPESRLQILELFLEKQDMTDKGRKIIPTLASDKYTKGYSGSDLKELCRAAAMEPIRELTKESSRLAVTAKPGMRSHLQMPTEGVKVRPVTDRDFLAALKKVKKTGQFAMEFKKQEGGNSSRQERSEAMSVLNGMQILGQLMTAQNNVTVANVEEEVTEPTLTIDEIPEINEEN